MATFSEKVRKLQQENEGILILVKNGIFYTAIGKDAVILNRILGNKTTCFGNGRCKCGIPASGMKRATDELKAKNIKTNIYVYNRENGMFDEKLFIEGDLVFEEKVNRGCDSCEYGGEDFF